jgi:hypothetical protein
MRKFILILPIVLLAIIVGIGLYFLFSPATTTTTGGQTGTLPNAGIQSNPGSATGTVANGNPNIGKNFGLISNEPVLDYFVNSANLVTAIEPSGKIVQISGGQVNTINSLLIQNIFTASFSHDGSKILVSFGDPTNPQTSVFDVTAKTWTPMSQGIMSPAWSPSDYRVAYYTVNNAIETLATIDASKAKPAPTTIMTIHAQDLALTWPTTNQLALATKPSSYAPGSAWLLNLKTKSLALIGMQVPGIDLLWQSQPTTPTSSLMGLQFVSTGSGLGGSLSLIDTSGNTIDQIKFLTLPSKCLFAATTATSSSVPSSYLFCGVPRDQDSLGIAHLPDDYLQMSLFTSDDIYRINLSNGAIDTVFNDATQNIDVSDAKFFNNMLFFVNRYDQKLYAISLSA